MQCWIMRDCQRIDEDIDRATATASSRSPSALRGGILDHRCAAFSIGAALLNRVAAFDVPANECAGCNALAMRKASRLLFLHAHQ
jgi:hypothetical protein